MEFRTTRLTRQLYRLLLCLYPPTFRREFGEEMDAVFTQLSSEARQRGLSGLASALWNELADLPASLLRQYWLALTRREGRMAGTLKLDQLLDEQYATPGGEATPSTWREATLAALPLLLPLPFLVFDRLLVLSGLTAWGSPLLTALDTIYAILIIAGLLAALVIAWRRKWPRWSASWFIIFWVLAFVPLLWLSSLYEDVSRTADLFSEFFGFFLLPMLIASALYYVARRDPLKSLLAVIPVLVGIWLPHTEFVPDQIEVPVSLVTLLIAALTAALITRLGNWRVGTWLLLLALALIGLPYAYIGIYHGGTLPFTAAGPSLLEVMRSFTPYYLMGATLVVGPLLAASLRAVGRSLGRGGDLCYHLALFGMLLFLGSVICSFFITMDSRIVGTKFTWLTLAAWLGLAGYLAGTVGLGWLAIRRKALSGWMQYLLLSLLILLLPVVLMLPFSMGWGYASGIVARIFQIYELVPSVNFVVGFAWLLLAGWLLTRRSSPAELQPI